MELKQEHEHPVTGEPLEQPAVTLMDHSISRRSFIQAILAVPAVSVIGCATSTSVSRDADTVPAFFSAAERQFVEAATERLIPSEETGTGAKEAAVAVFIDRQLAGPYGRAETWYMQGPWQQGTQEQGYQLKLTPAQVYRAAIRNLDDYCRRTYANKTFAELVYADQDQTLHGLEQGSIELADVPAKEFFGMLLQNTVEGFLADPLYGGNRNFTGWKLIGFPGPRYNYSNEITQYGKPYTLPTVGLMGRDGSITRRG